MSIFTLTMHANHAEAIRKHLLRDDGRERAGYLLCRAAKIDCDPWDRQSHEKFLVRDFIPVPDEELIESTPTRVTWPTDSFALMLKEAEANGQTVAIVHNHPTGCLAFSKQDNDNEPDLVQMAINRNGQGTRILSLIMTPDGQFIGRIWQHPSKAGCTPLSMIRVIGSRFKLHYPERVVGTDIPAFNRQALALGKSLNQDLRKLKIGIVGCGGTGSAVAMLLARLGVGQIALFDKDIVDETNLNRLHGSRQADADAMRPKVEVVAENISEMGLGIRVITVEAWIDDGVCRNALKSCDIIFGCTDDDSGRIILNRFAYFYLTPVIDVGLAIEVGKEAVPKISAFDGRVTVLMPENPCLLCHEIVDVIAARDESLKRSDPNEYEKRKAEAYVVGEEDPNPAVVTFTTETACMGVNEMIHRLQGFRGENGNVSHRVRKFNKNVDRIPGPQEFGNCSICDLDEIWGVGDCKNFLGLAG